MMADFRERDVTQRHPATFLDAVTKLKDERPCAGRPGYPTVDQGVTAAKPAPGSIVLGQTR
ncbi:hypothetical protein [Micromonospora sp. NPDC006431]|uniref:hypothetical protein n=1 Tax=Micromonospora sp. NPDC006431 TaxID=3364235 RepID=UPI0036844A50